MTATIEGATVAAPLVVHAAFALIHQDWEAGWGA